MDTLPETTVQRAILNRETPTPSRRQLLRLGMLAAGLVVPASWPPAVGFGGRDGRDEALFDGASLGAWRPITFGGEGEVRVENKRIILGRGNDLTGIVWTGKALPDQYSLEVEAMRLDGTDFFCALTFPVAGSHCTFVVGGWGGSLIGLSNLDGLDASENETAEVRRLADNRWYRIGVRVTATAMQASLDDEVLAEIALAGRDIDVRAEMELCRPLGIASYRTVAAIRRVFLTA